MTLPSDPALATKPAAAATAIPSSPAAVQPAAVPEHFIGCGWFVCWGSITFRLLAYQPSADPARLVGKHGPLATGLVVLVTLAGLLAGLLLPGRALAHGARLHRHAGTAGARLARQDAGAGLARFRGHRLRHAQDHLPWRMRRRCICVPTSRKETGCFIASPPWCCRMCR